MARWRLTDNHYLHGEYPGEGPTQWQHTETNRDTGRVARKNFMVPAYLAKETIVCQDEKNPRDFAFIGPPTPEMEPLDDEAEAISAKHRAKWQHPIEGLAGTGGFNEALLANFNAQVEKLMSLQPLQPVAAAPVGNGPTREEFEELQRQLQMVLAERAAEPETEAEEELEEA